MGRIGPQGGSWLQQWCHAWNHWNMVPVGFIYAVSPLLLNTLPFSWGSRSRPEKGGDGEGTLGACSSRGEFILALE